MQRKSISITLIIIMMVAICIGCGSKNGILFTKGELKEAAQYSLSISNVAFDLAISEDGQTIAIADKDFVHLQNKDGKSLKKFQHTDPFYTKVAFAEDEVWAYNMLSDQFDIFSVSQDYQRSFSELPEDLDEIILFKIYKNNLLAIYGTQAPTDTDDGHHHNEMIWLIDLHNSSSIKIQDTPIMSFAFNSKGELAVLEYDNKGPLLNFYNTTTVEPIRESRINSSSAASIGFDPQDKIYFVTDRAIFTGGLDNTDANTIEYLPLEKSDLSTYNESAIRIFTDTTNVYIWYVGDDDIFGFPQDGGTKSKSIAFESSFYVPQVLDIYENENKGKRVNYIEVSDFGTDRYLTMLMSQDDSVDIFLLSSYVPGAEFLLNKGFFTDLSISAKIDQDSQTWFSPIRQASMIDDELFGYPVYIEPVTMEVNQELIKDMNIPIDNSLIWSDLLESLKPYKDAPVFPLIIGPVQLKEMILREALQARVDEKSLTEALNEAFITLKGCQELGMFDLSPTEYMEAYPYDGSFVLRMEYMPINIDNGDKFVAHPKLQNTPMSTDFRFDWLIINPFSKNKQDSLKFVEAHVDGKSQGYLSWGAVLSDSQKENPDVHPNWMENYKDMLPNLRVFFDDKLVFESLPIVEQFLNGQLSQADAISQIESKLRMRDQEE